MPMPEIDELENEPSLMEETRRFYIGNWRTNMANQNSGLNLGAPTAHNFRSIGGEVLKQNSLSIKIEGGYIEVQGACGFKYTMTISQLKRFVKRIKQELKDYESEK